MAHTVLVINDNEDLTETLGLFFETKGYTVVLASNGLEALDRLETGLRPCVILLDLMMPVMSGSQFRTEQLKHPDYGQIPIVLTSVVSELRESAERLGAAGYVRLPGELDRLIELVRSCCGP
jgi:CheY-like chemotaxis protein